MMKRRVVKVKPTEYGPAHVHLQLECGHTIGMPLTSALLQQQPERIKAVACSRCDHITTADEAVERFLRATPVTLRNCLISMDCRLTDIKVVYMEKEAGRLWSLVFTLNSISAPEVPR